MPKVLERIALRAINGNVQTVPLQRRARIVGCYESTSSLFLLAEVEHDDTTRSVDVKHQRHFQIVRANAGSNGGGLIPEGCAIVASCGNAAVYEVRNV